MLERVSEQVIQPLQILSIIVIGPTNDNVWHPCSASQPRVPASGDLRY